MFEGLIHVFCDLSKDDREFLRDITKSGPQEKSTVLEAEPSSDSELINRETEGQPDCECVGSFFCQKDARPANHIQ